MFSLKRGSAALHRSIVSLHHSSAILLTQQFLSFLFKSTHTGTIINHPARKKQLTQSILIMHKDVEGMEALCQSAVMDGGKRQMFTEGNATQKGSGLQSCSVCIR